MVMTKNKTNDFNSLTMVVNIVACFMSLRPTGSTMVPQLFFSLFLQIRGTNLYLINFLQEYEMLPP